VGKMPEIVTPGGDNEYCSISGLTLPLNIPGLAEGITPSYHVNFTNNSKTDEEKLVVGIEHGVPIGNKYHYTKKNDTADTAGTEVDMSSPNRRLVALLLYATTIPSTSNLNRSIKEVKIIVGGKEHYHFNWFELGQGYMPKNAVDDTTLGTVLDNYRIILFPEGIPASALTVWTKSATATDTLELIGIYQ